MAKQSGCLSDGSITRPLRQQEIPNPLCPAKQNLVRQDDIFK